jgi:hypothetical protein
MKLINLKKWDVVFKVLPHSKVDTPNNDDYHINANTYEAEFYQEADNEDDEDEGMEFKDEGVEDEDEGVEDEDDGAKDEDDDIEVDNVQDKYGEVQDPKDLALLMRM